LPRALCASHRDIPVVILTGDISPETLRVIALHDCMQLSKPVKLHEITKAIQQLLVGIARPERDAERALAPEIPTRPTIFIVDDDDQVSEAMRMVLEEDGRSVETFPSAEAFLAAYRPGSDACLVIDAYLPGMNGLDLLRRLRADGDRLPAVMITGHGDVPMAVQAMKAGATDFIEKPVGRIELLASITLALEQSQDAAKASARSEEAKTLLATLTARQRQIMAMVLAGHPNKNIAADLGISQRTVENHRATIMQKTGAKSLPALARLALASERS
jgi:two-component system CheB/CheR fusion protein